MGRGASLQCNGDDTSMPTSLTFRCSKHGSGRNGALAGGGLCPKMSLLINHLPAPESPVSTNKKRGITFIVDVRKATQKIIIVNKESNELK